jgi:NAD(P)H-hydrate epimerase
MARRLVTPDEMQRADALTIEAGTPASVLMDRAGRAVARTAIRVAGGRYGKRALVVCGKGNNGGDGFVVARVLANEGLTVRCVTLFDPDEAQGAAREHLTAMSRAGVSPVPYDNSSDDDWDVVVDAIFGTGFKGEVQGQARDAVECVNRSGRVVSVDIPSGVNGETGAVEGTAVDAFVTVAIAAQKLGTAVPAGSTHAGGIEVVDIGIDVDRVQATAWMCEMSDVRSWLEPRLPDAHKKSSAIFILAGSEAMSGAAILSSRGALRMGSGYVTLGTPKSVKGAGAQVPELIVRTVEGDTLGPDALDAFAEGIEQADAVAIGPGLGRGERQTALVERIVKECPLPLVLDADALNALEGRVELLAARSAVTVLTPHPGELARLLGTSTKAVVADRLAAAREIASQVGPNTAILAKGHRSVVAGAGEKALWVVPTGGPELATAGTGDVLTGAVTALLGAAGKIEGPPVQQVLAAAYVHGVAGTEAGRRVGPSGVVAWDVAEALPEAVRNVTAGIRS